jgi:hypothetical protein
MFLMLNNEGNIGRRKLKSNDVTQLFHDEVPPGS